MRCLTTQEGSWGGTGLSVAGRSRKGERGGMCPSPTPPCTKLRALASSLSALLTAGCLVRLRTETEVRQAAKRIGGVRPGCSSHTCECGRDGMGADSSVGSRSGEAIFPMGGKAGWQGISQTEEGWRGQLECSWAGQK